MLGVLHEDAAAQNDKLHLFASEDRFLRVFQLAAELTDAEAALEGLLPGLKKQLGLPRLAYISLANQGDYLVEVPADRRDVPKARIGAACALHVPRGCLGSAAQTRARWVKLLVFRCIFFNRCPVHDTQSTLVAPWRRTGRRSAARRRSTASARLP